jgi:glucose/arabinose dehydrogenase
VRRTRVAACLAAVLLGVAACSSRGSSGESGDLGTTSPAPQPSTLTAGPSQTLQPSRSIPHVVRVVARNLQVPWGVTFLPDGTALVGERDTTRVVAIDGKRVRTVGHVAGVHPQGEAGLLGLAVSPHFAEDRLVFAYLSTSQDNRVVTMRYEGRYDAGRLGPPKPVLTGIPNGYIHDGGRLLFAPDGNLFGSTGETGNGPLAQDPHSLAGKILRITAQGHAAAGNPVKGSAVWTMGHRNVQGLAFDGSGQLWATEFGQDTWDELNRIDKGRNYGWPIEEGRGTDKRFRNPYVQWRTDDASPSGLAYLDSSLWAGALRGGRLWQVPLRNGTPQQPRDFFVGEFGRMRTVVVAPDRNLWVTTSNRDGRGSPKPGDDKILEIAPR